MLPNILQGKPEGKTLWENSSGKPKNYKDQLSFPLYRTEKVDSHNGVDLGRGLGSGVSVEERLGEEREWL